MIPRQDPAGKRVDAALLHHASGHDPYFVNLFERDRLYYDSLSGSNKLKDFAEKRNLCRVAVCCKTKTALAKGGFARADAGFEPAIR
jgi:hypothetical protein